MLLLKIETFTIGKSKSSIVHRRNTNGSQLSIYRTILEIQIKVVTPTGIVYIVYIPAVFVLHQYSESIFAFVVWNVTFQKSVLYLKQLRIQIDQTEQKKEEFNPLINVYFSSYQPGKIIVLEVEKMQCLDIKQRNFNPMKMNISTICFGNACTKSG